MTGEHDAATIERDLLEHVAALVSQHADASLSIAWTGSLFDGLLRLRELSEQKAQGLFLGRGRLDLELSSVVRFVEENILSATCSLGRSSEQSEYEVRYIKLEGHLQDLENRLETRRYLMGSGAEQFCYADCLLFAFLVRLEPVFYLLFKATFEIETFPHLFSYARDLWERPELERVTDLAAIKELCFCHEPALNPKGIVPQGKGPDFHRPHRRHLLASPSRCALQERGTEETGVTNGHAGEWVRSRSAIRERVSSEPGAEFPPAVGRYHLFAPLNCPWSHRALLGRSVKGLSSIVSASILYFRRDPDHGWQFNARIPGCTVDHVSGRKYLEEYYRRIGSQDRSAPVLWDTHESRMVSNESADILRMFDDAFSEFLPDDALCLRPPGLESEIDELNELIYQRINNGAYKAGFATSQQAYERAFERYFSALGYLDEILAGRDFLCATSAPAECDVRLFPSVFRHDCVYFARFSLNRCKLSSYRHLSAWLERMLAFPGVAEASNLDHARNGYFGRTTNEIVPFGPKPLGLSPSQYRESIWLNED